MLAFQLFWYGLIVQISFWLVLDYFTMEIYDKSVFSMMKNVNLSSYSFHVLHHLSVFWLFLDNEKISINCLVQFWLKSLLVNWEKSSQKTIIKMAVHLSSAEWKTAIWNLHQNMHLIYKKIKESVWNLQIMSITCQRWYMSNCCFCSTKAFAMPFCLSWSQSLKDRFKQGCPSVWSDDYWSKAGFCVIINPGPAEPYIPCLCKQCRSRSVGFWHCLSLSKWICINKLDQEI